MYISVVFVRMMLWVKLGEWCYIVIVRRIRLSVMSCFILILMLKLMRLVSSLLCEVIRFWSLVVRLKLWKKLKISIVVFWLGWMFRIVGKVLRLLSVL